MSKKFVLFSGIALLLLLIGVVGVSGVLAQEPTPEPNVPPVGEMPGRGGFGRGGEGMRGRGHNFSGQGWGQGGDWTMFDTAAETLGLTPEELFSELHSGKTLPEVAEEQGVEIETLREALQAARQEAMRQAAEQAIERAVENGRMSQEQAEWLREGLENGFIPLGMIRGMRQWNPAPRAPAGDNGGM